MPKFNKQFIGHEYPNESFLKDHVLYKYNNLGHRCKNVDDINLDNYILFAGCSHTFGEALFLEQTYPYVTSQLLNCDYYNLGVPATGLDVLFYNVMTWVAMHKPPKFVVLQYPDHTRFSAAVNNSPLILPYGPWTTDQDVLDIIVKSEDKNVFALKNLLLTRILNNSLKVPIVKLVFGSTKSYDDTIRVERLDYAIDGLHFGIETHRNCAEIIEETTGHLFQPQ